MTSLKAEYQKPRETSLQKEDNLKILSVEQEEAPVTEITINELAELVRQRAELDKKIARIKQVVNNEGNIMDVSSEQAKELVIEMNSQQLGNVMQAEARKKEPAAEKQFNKAQENNEDVSVEVSPEELALAKSVLPVSQYVTTLQLSQGEEGNFFKQKIKDIAEVVKNAPKCEC